MTSQSLPISKTKSDYILSVVALIAIAGATAAAVFLTKPNAIIMRQPRMTIVLAVGFTILVTAFIFIGKNALPFYSRVLAYSSVGVSIIFLFALGFFNHDGRSGAWFRFGVLILFITAGLTLLSEIMIGYRRFVADKNFKNAIWHKIIFAVVCGTVAAGATYIYYEKALDTGAVISYEVPKINTPISDPQTSTPELNTSVPGETQASTPGATETSAAVVTIPANDQQ